MVPFPVELTSCWYLSKKGSFDAPPEETEEVLEIERSKSFEVVEAGEIGLLEGERGTDGSRKSTVQKLEGFSMVN